MSRKPPGTLSERLAIWLESRQDRLLPAGAGSAADRRIARAVLSEIRQSLSKKPALGTKRGAAARLKEPLRISPATDPAPLACVVGALRDRTLTLLSRSRARDAAAFRRLADRAFVALMAEYLSEASKSSSRGRRRSRVESAHDAIGDEPSMRMILERVFEDSQQAILVLDDRGSIVHANRALGEWYGYPIRRLLTMKVTDLVAKPYRNQFPARLRRLLKEGHRVIEAIHVRRDGTILNVEVSSWVLSLEKRRLIVSILRDITEKKRTEGDLRHVLSGAQCLVWEATVRARGKRFAWEPMRLDDGAAQRFLPLKLRRGEEYERAWLRARRDEDVVNSREAVARAIRSGKAKLSHEFGCVDTKGQRRWIHEDILIERSGRTTWRLAGLCTDVTRETQAAAELRESVARFRKVFEAGPLGVALAGLDYSFQSVNRTLCDMLGYEEAELTGRKFADITHPDDIEKDLDLAIKLFRGEIPHYVIEKRYLKKGGGILWINLTASVIRDKDERPLYGLAMIEDISERMRANEDLEKRVSERTLALSESEEKFRTIFENAPVLIDSFDDNGRCVLWNKECEKTLGWTKEEILASEDPLALTYPDPAVRDRILEKVSRGDGIFREDEVRTRDGSKRIQLWANFRLPNGSLISLGLDITDRKRTENALREARDELEARVQKRTAELTRAVEKLEQEVLERERAESGLRESEAKLTALIENATEAIWSIDTQGKLVAFNSYFSEQITSAFGRRPEVGKEMEEVLEGASLAPVRAFMQPLFDRALGGESFSVETARRIKGVKHLFILSMQPILDAGEIRGATVYTKDVTTLKMAEETLAYQVEFEKVITRVSQAYINVEPGDLASASEEALRFIGGFAKADRSRLFLFTRDLKFLEEVYEWCAEGVEPEIERVKRMPPDLFPRIAGRLVGTGVANFSSLSVLPAGSDEVRAEFEQEGVRSLLAVPLISKGQQLGILVLHSVQRERAWSEETLRLLRIAAEIIANAIERSRAQSALAELSRRNKLLLDAAGEGIYGLDMDGRATFVNPAAARMIGWGAEDLIGKSMHPILHHTRPDGRPYPAEECPIYAAFRDGVVRRSDDEIFWRSDGSSFPAEYISTPILEEGRPVGAVVTFKDITLRKRAEEALLRVVQGTSGSVGEDFFRSLVKHLAAALRVRFAFLAECIDGAPDRARMLAFWEEDRFGECIEYPVKDTPCENVFEHEQNFYPSGVRERYPKDVWLSEIGAESYLAMPVYDSRGRRMAHLGVLDDAPMTQELSRDPILRIFAARAGAEVERKRAEDALAHQAEMEKVIGAISKRFVNVGPGEMDDAIDNALRIMGIFSEVDRSYLFRFSENHQIIDNSNEWCAEGIESQINRIKNIPSSVFPWAIAQMIKIETVIVERIADLPSEAAAEIAELQVQGVKSFLAVPVVFRNKLIGSIALGSIRTEKPWSETTLQVLQRLSEIMANALARDMAEGEFKQLSHKNQLILDVAGEGIYGADTSGRATFINPAAARMCGWEVGDLIGKPLHDVLHHTHPDGTTYPMEDCPIYATLMRGVVQRVNQELFWRKDGTSFPVEYISTPIREKGEISGVVVTFNDITERQRAEELRYHAQLLSQLPDAVLVMEEDWLISFWSKGAEELTGYPVQEMLGQNIGHVLAEGDPGGGLAAILNRISGTGTGKEYQGEHLIRRKDGQTRLIAIHLHPSPDPDGKRQSWIGIAQDVTEARGIQEEMFQAQRLAEVGTLAAGVAHEINNPLTVLSGNIQSLLQRARKKDPDRRRFEQMKRVCDRIGSVVNALARISAQEGDQWSLVNANDVVEETLLLIEQLHSRKGAKLIRRYSRDLPRLRLLQNGLQQVMMNIVMNAIDAIGDQEGEVIVETSQGPASFVPPQGRLPAEGVSATNGAPSVCIRVTDTGCGISEQERPKIFLPFFTTKEPGKGTGLGLAVARSIISIHRGTIDVESEIGKGTTFTIILPAS